METLDAIYYYTGMAFWLGSVAAIPIVVTLKAVLR